MFQDATLKPLLTEESYTLHGKEAQLFFVNKLYTARHTPFALPPSLGWWRDATYTYIFLENHGRRSC